MKLHNFAVERTRFVRRSPAFAGFLMTTVRDGVAMPYEGTVSSRAVVLIGLGWLVIATRRRRCRHREHPAAASARSGAVRADGGGPRRWVVFHGVPSVAVGNRCAVARRAAPDALSQQQPQIGFSGPAEAEV